MKVNNVSLTHVGVAPKQYPDSQLPEIAFVGRSNVGKSSLINAMIYRKALARTSKSPGKTRTINFYNIEDTLYFVDLPGYGYAKTAKSQSQQWGSMIETYLKKRTQLKAIIMLVDIRHEPSKDDVAMFEWLSFYGYQMLVVATKTDKINRSQLQKQLKMVSNCLNLPPSVCLFPFSSETKAGREELWSHLDQLITRIDNEDSQNIILSSDHPHKGNL